MTTSTLRTVTIGTPGPSTYGTMPGAPLYRWNWQPEPGDSLDYYVNVAAFLADVGDTLASVSVTVQPSGTGELQPSNLTVSGQTIGFWLSGGVAGRNYIVVLEVQTVGGRTREWPIGLTVDPTLAVGCFPPPSTGPGAALTWTADGTLAAAGAYLTLSTLGQWPTSNAGLAPGALYAASTTAPAFVFAVPGFGYVPGAPMTLTTTTAAALLAAGAMTLPQTDPHVVGQFFLNGDIVCVSQG